MQSISLFPLGKSVASTQLRFVVQAPSDFSADSFCYNPRTGHVEFPSIPYAPFDSTNWFFVVVPEGRVIPHPNDRYRWQVLATDTMEGAQCVILVSPDLRQYLPDEDDPK